MQPLYPKIQSVFRRDRKTHKFLPGQWSTYAIGYLSELPWTWSEKVDGTNIRLWRGAGGRLAIGGRTERAQLPAPLVEWLHQNVDPSKIPEGAYLFGEGFGGKIQKGSARYGTQQRFVLFDVKVGDYWLKRSDVHDVGTNQVGVEVVQEVMEGTILDAMEAVQAKSWKSSWEGNVRPEGLVGRPLAQLWDRFGQRVLVKVKDVDLVGLDLEAFRAAAP